MPDWDAERYHRLSEPQVAWGRSVLARLAPASGERILDIGCGTGRLTAEMASVPGIFVVGLDRSASMLAEAARRNAAGHVAYVRADGADLPIAEALDAVFSAATFHWIADHERLFSEISRVLRPGGRLVAQCGGEGNLRRLHDRTHVLMDSTCFAEHFRGWSDPWNYASVEDTLGRLGRSGFVDAEASIVPAPTTFPHAQAYSDFISCVCVRYHVDRLPSGPRSRFVAELARLAAEDDPPFTLDYRRLNITARKGFA